MNEVASVSVTVSGEWRQAAEAVEDTNTLRAAWLRREQGDASDDLLKDTSPVRAGDQPRCVFGPGWIQRDQMCASGESDDASESEPTSKGEIGYVRGAM